MSQNEQIDRLAKLCDRLLERQQQLYDLNVRHEEIMTLGLHRMAMHLGIDWDSFCKGINDERAEWIQKRDIEHLTNCWRDGDDNDQ